MRRVAAILLLFVLSFSLIAPALSADAESNLPACCRRGGKHHCSMMGQDMAEAPPSGPAVNVLHTRCPFFPNGSSILPHSGSALLAASQPADAAMVIRIAAPARAEAGYRISLDSSHQKRGPPSLLS